MEDSLSKHSKHLLKQMIMAKAHYILSKGKLKEEDVYDLIKDFFKEFLQAHYEFTIDELIEELKKIYLETHVWKKLNPLLEKIKKIEYSDKKYSEEDLREIVKEFLHILSIIITSKMPKKKAWHHKLTGFMRKNKEQKMEEFEDVRINSTDMNEIYNEVETAIVKAENNEAAMEAAEAPTAVAALEPTVEKTQEAELDSMDEMNKIIEKISRHLDKNQKAKAKKLYKHLDTLYQQLDNEDKKDYYEVINKIYEKVS